MAKITAKGCTELARMVKEEISTEPDVTRRRTEYLLRSDGAVLKKQKVWWRNPGYAGPSHDWGWAIVQRASQFTAESFRARLTAKGYSPA